MTIIISLAVAYITLTIASYFLYRACVQNFMDERWKRKDRMWAIVLSGLGAPLTIIVLVGIMLIIKISDADWDSTAKW